jgi:hypothetical protein
MSMARRDLGNPRRTSVSGDKFGLGARDLPRDDDLTQDL